ncbi:hypothetical protein Tco_0867041, partial [Tanacetum coccineum]
TRVKGVQCIRAYTHQRPHGKWKGRSIVRALCQSGGSSISRIQEKNQYKGIHGIKQALFPGTGPKKSLRYALASKLTEIAADLRRRAVLPTQNDSKTKRNGVYWGEVCLARSEFMEGIALNHKEGGGDVFREGIEVAEDVGMVVVMAVEICRWLRAEGHVDRAVYVITLVRGVVCEQLGVGDAGDVDTGGNCHYGAENLASRSDSPTVLWLAAEPRSVVEIMGGEEERGEGSGEVG